MLTKTDLEQIRKLLREEVETEAENTRDSLGSELRLARMEIQKDIRELSNRVKNLEIASNKLQKHALDLKKGFKRIEKKLDKSIDFLDRDHLRTVKRVDRIEQHLKLVTSI